MEFQYECEGRSSGRFLDPRHTGSRGNAEERTIRMELLRTAATGKAVRQEHVKRRRDSKVEDVRGDSESKRASKKRVEEEMALSHEQS